MASPARPAANADVARTLRRARKRLGVDISEAAKTTCIALQYLKALEEDAPVNAFPAPVYARWYLREYARFLGLDEEPLVEAFVSRNGFGDEPLLEEMQLPEISVRPRWPRRLLVGTSVAILLGLAVAGLTRRGPALPPIPTPATVAVTAIVGPPHPAGFAALHDHAAPVKVSGVRAVLDLTAPSWVQAVADGRTILQQTLPGGGSVTLRARTTLTLVLGNAGGVRLMVNGRPVATGANSQVAHLAFAWRHGRLVSM